MDSDSFCDRNITRILFFQKYTNVQFLKPLVDSMTRQQPNERLKPEDALNELENIVSQRSKASLRRRLIKFDKRRNSRFFVSMKFPGSKPGLIR